MKKIYTLLLFISIVNISFSQPEIEWQKTIGGSLDDKLKVIQKTDDGGFILGGDSRSNISGDKTENTNGWEDYWIVKTDAAGNIQWQNTIGGSSSDLFTTILQTADGGYIIGGYTFSNISGDKTENVHGDSDYWVVKTDATGNIQWQNNIGGNGTDRLYSIQQTFDGGYILGGTSSSGVSGDKTEINNGLIDYWILKTDSMGDIQWQQSIGGSGHEDLRTIKQTLDGGFILGGMSNSNISGDKSENSHGLYDYWIVKTDTTGNIQWEKTIGGSSNDRLYSVHQTADGGYILGGTSDSNYSGDKTENRIGLDDYWIVKTDASGNIQWQNTIGGVNVEYLYSIQQTADGGYILGGISHSGISGDKTENSNGFFDYWLIKIDAIGNIQWQKTIGGDNDDFLYLVQEVSDGSYILGGYSSSNFSGNKTDNSKGAHDYWIVKVTTNFNTITGKAFIDLNTNSLHDAGESGLKNHQVYESNAGKINYSGNDGIYYLNVLDSGNFFPSMPPIPYYWPSPITHSVYFSGINQTDSLNDFAFQPLGIFNDLQVKITPLGAFRPGFDAYYNIHYKNVGTTSLTGTVIFAPDSNITFVSTSVAPNSITIDSIYWNLPVLNPFDEGNILVTVHVDVNTVLGSITNSGTKIEPVIGDAYPGDNQAWWEVLITGSFDPNDILVDKDKITTTELVNPPYLEYLIRFQNTGTDTAFTVKIMNNITDMLNVSTFEFVNASHPVEINYGNHSHLFEFKFDNILLPDSNTNELLSHGFIRYRIKPFDTLSVGDIIENTAAIYFDFNAPVITNTAVTEVVLPVSVPHIKNIHHFSLYPNPTTSELNITFQLDKSSDVKVELYNSLGQLVKTISDKKLNAGENKISISTGNIPPGIYHLKFAVDEILVTKKIVKIQ